MCYGRERTYARNGSQASYRSSGARAFGFARRLGHTLAGTRGLLVLFLAVVKFLEQQLSACAASAGGRRRDHGPAWGHGTGSEYRNDRLWRSGTGLRAAAATLHNDGGRERVRCRTGVVGEPGGHGSRRIPIAIAGGPFQKLDDDGCKFVAAGQRGPSAERLYAGRVIRSGAPACRHDGRSCRRRGRLSAAIARRYFFRQVTSAPRRARGGRSPNCQHLKAPTCEYLARPTPRCVG